MTTLVLQAANPGEPIHSVSVLCPDGICSFGVEISFDEKIQVAKTPFRKELEWVSRTLRRGWGFSTQDLVRFFDGEFKHASILYGDISETVCSVRGAIMLSAPRQQTQFVPFKRDSTFRVITTQPDPNDAFEEFADYITKGGR